MTCNHQPPPVLRAGLLFVLVASSVWTSSLTAEDPPVAAGDEAEELLPDPDQIPARLASRPWGVGEYFKFSLQYGPIKAGTATLAVEEIVDVDGRPCYRLASEAKSNVVFSAFYKVRDRVESYIDVAELLTRRSTKKLSEGGYKREELVDWDQDGGLVFYRQREDREVEIQPGTRDILGAFYYVRAMDLKVGDRVPLHTHDDEKTYDLWINILREETIETPMGRFDCFVAEPQLLTDGLFKRSGSLSVWFTRDESRMPVMMQSKIKVGAVSAILVDMKRGRKTSATAPATLAN